MSEERERTYIVIVESSDGEEEAKTVTASKLGSYVLNIAQASEVKQVGYREEFFGARSITVDLTSDEQLEPAS